MWLKAQIGALLYDYSHFQITKCESYLLFTLSNYKMWILSVLNYHIVIFSYVYVNLILFSLYPEH